MGEVDALKVERELSRTFRRYLFSANGIAESEPELREAFWNALGRQDLFARQPLLSAMPAYRRDKSADDLIRRASAPHLHPGLASLDGTGFETSRPLYSHQVASIERLQNGRNLIVASGTGSGKTECFMLPVLDDALRNAGPGVRAVIVYPLNALANDQLHRLRVVLRKLPQITFGRYTGETPYTLAEMSPEDRAEVSTDNERATREEIRREPPHILLTNFAMLEYLLLRPADADVFRHNRLRFVVLDEAHTYQGAQGIDVGFLMRRLRQQHYRQAIQHILTSATLGDDPAAVAAFGHALTGGVFEVGDVITGEPVSGFAPACVSHPFERYLAAVPNDQELGTWASVIDDGSALRSRLLDHGLAESLPQGLEPPVLLYKTFWQNADMARLHRLLSASPKPPPEVALELWGRNDADATRVVQWLGLLGANAVKAGDEPPLVPLKHHLFFKGLQAATVCLSPRCEGFVPERGWGHFMLQDREHCELCGARVLPLISCAHCGLPVCRVFQPNGQATWRRMAGLPGSARGHLLTWRSPESEGGEGDDQEDVLDTPTARVCLQCGGFAPNTDAPCDCDPKEIVTLFMLRGSPEGNLQKCPNCRGTARQFPSVLREFGTGEDAATAVLGETLLRLLPAENERKPAGGRRLLAFSDSRQRAAYFAPYLQRTTGETQVMMPLVGAIDRALRDDPDGAPLSEVAFHFAKVVERQPFVIVRNSLDEDGEEFGVTVKAAGDLNATDRAHLRRDCSVALLRHFAAQGRRRDTLPGLAIAALAVGLTANQKHQLGLLAEALGLNGNVVEQLVQHLLGIVVRRRALELPSDVTARMLGPGPLQATMHRTDAGGLQGRSRVRWNSYLAKVGVERVVLRSPQVAAIAAVFGVHPLKDRARIEKTLESTWEWMRDRVFRQIAPNEYVLPVDGLVVRRPESWRVCTRCGVVTPWAPVDTCLMPQCRGILQKVHINDEGRFGRNHQRARFLEFDPLAVEVREHTAQLTLQTGRHYQRRFMAGDVNVLSSSTTFEMGIDVGLLRAILLRNVPPTAANYTQRAGRAGRRREGAAFAVTYARAVPHDQTHFYEAEKIAGGSVAVPRIRVANARLGQRHVNSLLLGRFLAHASLTDDRITVGEFFEAPSPEQSPAVHFSKWLHDASPQLAASVAAILPVETPLTAGEALEGAGRGIEALRGVVADELREFRTRQEELKAAFLGPEGEKAVRALKAAERLYDEYLKNRLIDFMAGEHWLPSYAFPQDVLRLRVMEPSYANTFRLERDAEYGIAEYAPGSEVIADGKLITSGAIDFRGRTPDVRHYRICRQCHNVTVDISPTAPPPTCPVCGATPPAVAARPKPFVVPPGFSTSLDKKVAEVRLSRLKPQRTSDVFLVSGVSPDKFRLHPKVLGVLTGYRSDGELFRANSGLQARGFRLCVKCGRYIESPGGHRTPYGIPCRGEVKLLDLAYRFETDTLQVRFDLVAISPPPISDLSFWLSLHTAFVSAASDVLNIPPRDLAGTYRAQDGGAKRGEIVVYDRVPGGAGYVQRIEQDLAAVLEATLNRVKKCPNPQCDVDASCYACLRSYQNQFHWDLLKRRTVVDWLEPALVGMGIL